ncbi:hypothetical protein AGMMS49959_16850 [Planctomycetales bacterium]|nr:hypothetical protein AGMMS49959_16850 [Planctomycetales bacterium]
MLISPSFEFDPDKSAKNLEKHGIDFVAAQQLWRDERLATVPPRKPPAKCAPWRMAE